MGARWAGRVSETASTDTQLTYFLKAAAIDPAWAMSHEIGDLSDRLQARALTMTYRQGRIAQAAFTRDGRVFVAGDRSWPWNHGWEGERSGYRTVRLWGARSGEPSAWEAALPDDPLLRAAAAGSVALSPDSTFAVIAAQDVIGFVDLTSGTVIDICASTLEQVAISPDSSRIAVAVNGEWPARMRIRLYDRFGHVVAEAREDMDAAPSALAFAPSGRSILTSDAHGLTVWHARTVNPIARYAPPAGSIVLSQFLPDDHLLVASTAGESSVVRELDPIGLRPIGEPIVAGHRIGTMAVSATGLLAIATG